VDAPPRGPVGRGPRCDIEPAFGDLQSISGSGVPVGYEDQLDHLTPELRRERFGLFGHCGLLEHKCSGVHETGGTSVVMMGIKVHT
jgi:hypothetical protein